MVMGVMCAARNTDCSCICVCVYVEGVRCGGSEMWREWCMYLGHQERVVAMDRYLIAGSSSAMHS